LISNNIWLTCFSEAQKSLSHIKKKNTRLSCVYLVVYIVESWRVINKPLQSGFEFKQYTHTHSTWTQALAQALRIGFGFGFDFYRSILDLDLRLL